MYFNNQPFRFRHRTDIVFGLESADRVVDELANLGGNAPMLVTDETITEVGVSDPIIDAFENADIDYFLFNEVEPNPRVDTVETGVNIVTEHNLDSIVGLGGGSSMDAAKAIAGRVSNGGHIADYQGWDKFEKEPLPTVTIPTTIGTGSEVTPGAVITDPELEEKLGIGSPSLIPDVAILDPTLLETLPPQVAASTGMDSLTQAVMGYISTDSNPYTDALLGNAVQLISENLPAAVGKKDRDALAQMQIATTMQGSGFMNSGLGLVHAMSHPVGAFFDTPHGVTNGIILPEVLRYNRIAREEKYADLAEAMGVDTRNMSTRTASKRFIDEVENLSAAVGIPSGLSDIGVEEDMLPTLAEAAATRKDTSSNKSTNPRESTEEDILKIYQDAF